MKPDLIIHSSDSNPFYLEFWPLVSKVWKIRFGIEPLLVYIGEDIEIDETYGRVIKMKPIPDVPIYLQCQWVRFWIPSMFPDKVCLLSDIDMFPVSRRYFVDQLESISDDKYVHLNPNHQFLPVCYHVAKGSVFKKVLQLDDDWETSIRNLHTMKLGHDCCADDPGNPILPGKIQWGSDEEYTSRLIRTYEDQSIFVWLNRTHQRIDRSNWQWSSTDISRDRYADAHSVRPYAKYQTEIDTFVEELLTNKILTKPFSGPLSYINRI